MQDKTGRPSSPGGDRAPPDVALPGATELPLSDRAPPGATELPRGPRCRSARFHAWPMCMKTCARSRLSLAPRNRSSISRFPPRFAFHSSPPRRSKRAEREDRVDVSCLAPGLWSALHGQAHWCLMGFAEEKYSRLVLRIPRCSDPQHPLMAAASRARSTSPVADRSFGCLGGD